MNYYRNGLVQRFVATLVCAGLSMSLILPATAGSSLMSGTIVAHLLGRTIDVPVDEAFWRSWDHASDSRPTTLTDFVSEFINAYEKNNGIPDGTLGSDPHALWNVLMGISVNIDPLSGGAILSSGWKSTNVTGASLRGLAERTPRSSLIVAIGSRLSEQSILVSSRSLLSSISPQGP